MTLQFDPSAFVAIYNANQQRKMQNNEMVQNSLNQIPQALMQYAQFNRQNAQQALQNRVMGQELAEKYGAPTAQSILNPTAPPKRILGQSSMVNNGQPMQVNPAAQPLSSFDLTNPDQYEQAHHLYGSEGIGNALAPQQNAMAIQEKQADIALKQAQARGAGGMTPQDLKDAQSGNWAGISARYGGTIPEKFMTTLSGIGRKTFSGVDGSGQPLFSDNYGNITDGSGQPYKGVVAPKNVVGPTAQARDTATFAKTMLPHFDELRGLINQADAAGYIGPAAGRVYGKFLAGKVGSTGNPQADQLLGELRATASLVASGALKVHFGARGGGAMYDHFTNNLDTTSQSKELLMGELNGFENFMKSYAQAGNIGGVPAPSGQGAPTPAPGGGMNIGRFKVTVH